MIITATIIQPVTIEVRVPDPPSDIDSVAYQDWESRTLATIFEASDKAYAISKHRSIINKSNLPSLEGAYRTWYRNSLPFSQDEEDVPTVRQGSSRPPKEIK